MLLGELKAPVDCAKERDDHCAIADLDGLDEVEPLGCGFVRDEDAVEEV